jgi:hypothetical protein
MILCLIAELLDCDELTLYPLTFDQFWAQASAPNSGQPYISSNFQASVNADAA